MEIRKLQIKSFGKLQNQVMTFSDGINLVYGENESGKSTVHTFIKSMLFGMERGRGRAAAKDTFSKYEPWDHPAYYAGDMYFEVGDKSFVLSRNFDKYNKNANLVCLEDGEELSVEDGDLEMLLDGLTEPSYENTLSVAQLGARPGSTLAAELTNYATNYYAAGDSELNLDAALRLLKEQEKETKRQTAKKTEEKQSHRTQIEQEMSWLWRDIHKLTEEQEELELEMEACRQKQRAQRKRASDNGEIELNHVIDEIRPEKWRIHPLEIVGAIAIIALVIWLIPRPWNSLIAIVLTLFFGIYIWNRMKVSKKVEKTESEIILEEITGPNEEKTLEKLRWEKERGAEELKDKQIQYENLKESLEELDVQSEEIQALEKRMAALQMASEKIHSLSAEMQQGLRKALNRRTSEIMSEITDGKYTRLFVDEDLTMSLLADGKRIHLDQVSQGTAEQVYFALRMAAIEVLHEEKYPIILDDTFGNYDDRRLERILSWLERCGRQVILFTCQKREENIMKANALAYHKIDL